MIKKVIIGVVAGFISGLFASGGGLIVLPACIYFLQMDEKEARATTIFSIMPMVVASAFFYFKSNSINYEAGIKTAIGGVIGSVIGSKLLKKVDNKYLKIIFVIFLIYAAINMLR